jgi:hypothetical protein
MKIAKETLINYNGTEFTVGYSGYSGPEKRYDYFILDDKGNWVNESTYVYAEVEKKYIKDVIEIHEVAEKLCRNYDKTTY